MYLTGNDDAGNTMLVLRKRKTRIEDERFGERHWARAGVVPGGGWGPLEGRSCSAAVGGRKLQSTLQRV